VKLNIDELKIQNNCFHNFNDEFSVFGDLKKRIFEIRMIGIFLLKKGQNFKEKPIFKYRINRKKSSTYRFLLYILFLIFFRSESISRNIRFFNISGGSTAFLIKKNVFLIGKPAIIRIYLRENDDKYMINIISSFHNPARRICKWDRISINNNDDDDDINSKYIKSRFERDINIINCNFRRIYEISIYYNWKVIVVI
jgi:hypothetical protein